MNSESTGRSSVESGSDHSDEQWSTMVALVSAYRARCHQLSNRSQLAKDTASNDEPAKLVSSSTPLARNCLASLAESMAVQVDDAENPALALFYFKLADHMTSHRLVHGCLKGCERPIERFLRGFFDTALDRGSFPSLAEDEGMLAALVFTGHYIPLHVCHAHLTVVAKGILRRLRYRDIGRVLFYLVCEMRGFSPVLALHVRKLV
jgi:hypothetical protein